MAMHRKSQSLACRVQSVLPGWLLRAFRVPSDLCTKAPGVQRKTKEQVEAWETYDNLNGDPDTTIVLPTYDRNGNRQNVRTSVAKLSLLSPDHAARKQNLINAMEALIEPGWFSRTKLPESDRGAVLTGSWRGTRGSLERPAYLYDAEKCLDIPAPARAGAPAFYSSSDPRAVPEWFPRARLSGHAVYPTPRLYSTDVPSATLRAAYEALCIAVHRHLEARNTTLRFHPAIVAANMQHNPDARFADPALWYPYSEWRNNNGNPEYYFRNTIRHAVVAPFNDGGGWTFTNHPLWSRSLDNRAEAVVLDSYERVTHGVYDLGSEAISFQVNVADAIADITRMMNVANHLLVSDDAAPSQRVLIDQHAAMTLKQNLQLLSFRHANLPSNQNINEALEAARLERDARYNRGLTQALGVAGYESTGDAGADITALAIDSIGLAMQAGFSLAAGNPIAGVVGGLVLFVVKFGVGLIQYFTAPDRPRDPLDLPFRILRGNDAPWASGAVRNSISLPVPYSAALIEPTVYRGL